MQDHESLPRHAAILFVTLLRYTMICFFSNEFENCAPGSGENLLEWARHPASAHLGRHIEWMWRFPHQTEYGNITPWGSQEIDRLHHTSARSTV